MSGGNFVSQPSEKNTGRLIVEGIVIVLSILLAFAIDAWWDERQERIEEADILLGLQYEFVGNREELQRRITLHSEIMLAIKELLVAARQGYWDLKNLSVDEAIGRLVSPPTSDLGSGVLDAMISAGRIEVLSNRDLRVKLAAWSGVFGEVHDDEVMNRAIVFERIVPYMTRWGVPMSRSLNIFSEEDWPLETRSLTQDPEAMKRLLTDPEFETLLEARYGFLSHTTGEYQIALVEIDKILEQIDASMSE